MLVIEVILIECSNIEHLGSGNNLEKNGFWKGQNSLRNINKFLYKEKKEYVSI